MSMTRSDIRATLRVLLNEPYAQKWSDTTLNTLINKAQDDVSDDLNAEFTRDATTDSVSGTQEYDLPSKFRRLISGRRVVSYEDTDGIVHDLVEKDLEWLIDTYGEDLYDTTNSLGTPNYFYIRDNKKIGFMDIPNYGGTNNVTLHCITGPTDFSDDTTASELVGDCKWAVARRAEVLAWQNLNKPFNKNTYASQKDAEIEYLKELQKLMNKGSFNTGEGIKYFGA